MKEFIKKFNTPADADQYAINDIPFTTAVVSTGQNLLCNLSGKKLVNVSGIVEVQANIPVNTILHMSDGSTVELVGSTITDEMTEPYYEDTVSVEIGSSVTSIGDYAFGQHDGKDVVYHHKFGNITSLIIPNNVTIIGNGVFYGCSGLTSISYTGTMSDWNKIELGNNWNQNIQTGVVHCTDGDVAI